LVLTGYAFIFAILDLSAIRTKSGRLTACILRKTWPRWIFAVISLIPSSAAILLVEPAGDDQLHHLPLASGQFVKPLVQLGDEFLFGTEGAILLQRHFNGIEEVLIVEGLGKKLDELCGKLG